MASVNVLFSKQKKLKLGALDPTDENIKRFCKSRRNNQKFGASERHGGKKTETRHFEV